MRPAGSRGDLERRRRCPLRSTAATLPLTGSFSGEDQFIVEPGDIASYSFPVTVDLQVRGTYW